jgi:hypothetical protein
VLLAEQEFVYDPITWVELVVIYGGLFVASVLLGVVVLAWLVRRSHRQTSDQEEQR